MTNWPSVADPVRGKKPYLHWKLDMRGQNLSMTASTARLSLGGPPERRYT